ncbi:hypothetical protein LTR62_006375 [Meristemomyces frigidus]|uniref:Asl1-like glycosyl hydrolase catalytic domain-containing protein n=1 Tax=Meristemomyces frigidus TaxID=1508187 RepID=A0AAN7YEK8_9PEZI|nr:hypothetical protein LTR62_006375 [Meristemomyces frigidus]
MNRRCVRGIDNITILVSLASLAALYLPLLLPHLLPMPSQSKRGLCWPTSNHGNDEPFPFTKPGSKISWLYNWSPAPTPQVSSLDFIPMQWNHIGIDALPANLQAANAKTLLAFNEPELPDQSNVPVDLAVKEWLRCIEPLRKQGVRCGSPGISSAPQGVVWLKEFVEKIRARGGDVDFYALHWYGEEVGQFYDHLWSTYFQLPGHEEGEGRKGVWVTEFAATVRVLLGAYFFLFFSGFWVVADEVWQNWNVDAPLSKEHVETFARDSVKYLDSLEWVERYAWFGPMRDCGTVGKWARMLDDDGKLTDLGKAYRDA